MVGGRVGDATPKANFWPAPTVAMCPSFAMRSRAAVTRRERERYKLFESRVEAEGPEEREIRVRHGGTGRRKSSLRRGRKKERKTWEDAR